MNDEELLVEAFRLVMKEYDDKIAQEVEAANEAKRPGIRIMCPIWWETLRRDGRWTPEWMAAQWNRIIKENLKRIDGSKDLQRYVSEFGGKAERRWLNMRKEK